MSDAEYNRTVPLPNPCSWEILLAVEAVSIKVTEADQRLYGELWWTAEVVQPGERYTGKTLYEIKRDHNPTLPTTPVGPGFKWDAPHKVTSSSGTRGMDLTTVSIAWAELSSTVYVEGTNKAEVFGLAELIQAEIKQPTDYGDPVPPPIYDPPIYVPRLPDLESPPVEPTPKRGRWAWVPSFARDTTVQIVAGIVLLGIGALAVIIFH